MDTCYTVQFGDCCVIGSKSFDSLTDAFLFIVRLKQLQMDYIELYWGPENCIWKEWRIFND